MAKAKAPTKAQLSGKLVEIVQANASGVYPYTSPEYHNPLIAEGLVETNPTDTDGNGGFATRATPKGIETVNTSATNGSPAAAAAAAVAAPKPTFTLQAAALPPITGRGVAKAETYPFSLMEVGQSFFVPATAENPNPAKSLASTVSGATKRFAVDTGQTKPNKAGDGTIKVLKPTRRFVVRARTAEAEAAEGLGSVAGARVYRVADATE